MNYPCDVDLFREWARAVCWRSFKGRTERRYNVAILFKRALGQGRITRVDGKPMGVAGLWALWKGKTDADSPITSFTLLTVNANNHALMHRYEQQGSEKRNNSHW